MSFLMCPSCVRELLTREATWRVTRCARHYCVGDGGTDAATWRDPYPSRTRGLLSVLKTQNGERGWD